VPRKLPAVSLGFLEIGPGFERSCKFSLQSTVRSMRALLKCDVGTFAPDVFWHMVLPVFLDTLEPNYPFAVPKLLARYFGHPHPSSRQALHLKTEK
jgi:hypothetical protein